MDMLIWRPSSQDKWGAVYDRLLDKRNALDLDTDHGDAMDRKLAKLQRIAWKRYRDAAGF